MGMADKKCGGGWKRHVMQRPVLRPEESRVPVREWETRIKKKGDGEEGRNMT